MSLAIWQCCWISGNAADYSTGWPPTMIFILFVENINYISFTYEEEFFSKQIKIYILRFSTFQ